MWTSGSDIAGCSHFASDRRSFSVGSGLVATHRAVLQAGPPVVVVEEQLVPDVDGLCRNENQMWLFVGAGVMKLGAQEVVVMVRSR